MISVLDQSDKIFDQIPDVKDDDTHLQLLSDMDAFVIDKKWTRRFSLYKNEWKQCNAFDPKKR